MFTLIKTQGAARRGRFQTVHGTVETPVFMNVATVAAIKGALSSFDLAQLKCQVELCNTYHLHLRPGDELVAEMGGLRAFMGWQGPVLTDSGGFQVFSLAALRQITEQGVKFSSHIDGRRIFMGPEESMRIQSNLGSTIAMAFDECVKNPSPKEYVAASCARTQRWAVRCREELDVYKRQDVDKLSCLLLPAGALLGVLYLLLNRQSSQPMPTLTVLLCAFGAVTPFSLLRAYDAPYARPVSYTHLAL